MADIYCTVYINDRKFELTYRQWIIFNEIKLDSQGYKPAIIEYDRTKQWCKNDKLHRIGGPAVIFGDEKKRMVDR